MNCPPTTCKIKSCERAPADLAQLKAAVCFAPLTRFRYFDIPNSVSATYIKPATIMVAMPRAHPLCQLQNKTFTNWHLSRRWCFLVIFHSEVEPRKHLLWLLMWVSCGHWAAITNIWLEMLGSQMHTEAIETGTHVTIFSNANRCCPSGHITTPLMWMTSTLSPV